MTVHDFAQRSQEWYAMHAGRFTSSRAADMLAFSKRDGKELEARKKLKRCMVAERFTGHYEDEIPFLPACMQRGVDLEPAAFAAYEAVTGQLVERVGFVSFSDQMVGDSPDGQVDDFTGVLELKIPKSTTHVEYMQAGVIPEDYLPQMRHHLWVTGAEWCDFVSFDDRFPEPLQLFRVRLTREAADIPGYEKAALAFLAEVETAVQALRTLANPAAVLAQVAAGA